MNVIYAALLANASHIHVVNLNDYVSDFALASPCLRHSLHGALAGLFDGQVVVANPCRTGLTRWSLRDCGALRADRYAAF